MPAMLVPPGPKGSFLTGNIESMREERAGFFFRLCAGIRRRGEHSHWVPTHFSGQSSKSH